MRLLIATLVLGGTAWGQTTASNTEINLLIGSDLNNADNPFVQPQDPALSGGGRDQTQQFGDVLGGRFVDDLILGRLGVDVIGGGFGNDVMVGGTEHFNPQNRDRAFGGPGADIFLWAPGDGSDFFDGGPGNDTVIFGLMGEVNDDNQLVFQVTNDQQAGNVWINPETGLPQMDLANSPGFCEVIDPSSSPNAGNELQALELDRLVQFFIRAAADSFESGMQDEDNGLRVTLHLKSVETLVCTNRTGGVIEAFDLRTSPPTPIIPGALPNRVQAIIQ